MVRRVTSERGQSIPCRSHSYNHEKAYSFPSSSFTNHKQRSSVLHHKARTILQNVCTNPQTNGKCIANEPDSRTFATNMGTGEYQGGTGRCKKEGGKEMARDASDRGRYLCRRWELERLLVSNLSVPTKMSLSPYVDTQKRPRWAGRVRVTD